MKGVVLAAGEGTRLQPLTDDRPKPLVEVAGKPVLERCFDILLDLYVDELVVVVGYKKDKIVQRYGDDYLDTPIEYVNQSPRKGLSHALLQAEPVVDDSFLLMHGDNVFAPSAQNDLEAVASSDADAALLVEELTPEEARESAVAVTDGEKVTDVVERSREPPSYLGVVGFYMLPPDVFELCRSTTDESERGEHELGDALSALTDSSDVRAVALDGDRVNVNTEEDLERACNLLR